MTTRARPPSEDVGIAMVGATRVRSESAAPADSQLLSPFHTRRPTEDFEGDATEVDKRVAGAGSDVLDAVPELVTPTEIDPPIHARHTERSEPIRVISMKAQADEQKARAEARRVPLHVQLRSMGEVARSRDTPVGLGHLAPPRDPQQARVRRARRYLLRAGVAIALATAIALAIWLIAGR
jgi:hypothetical protein